MKSIFMMVISVVGHIILGDDVDDKDHDEYFCVIRVLASARRQLGL